MTTAANFRRDLTGSPLYSPSFSDMKYSMLLAANTAQSFTVPSTYSEWAIVFSPAPGSSVWISNNATAAIPTGTVAASTCELNPQVRMVRGGDVLSFITSNANVEMGFMLYAFAI